MDIDDLNRAREHARKDARVHADQGDLNRRLLQSDIGNLLSADELKEFHEINEAAIEKRTREYLAQERAQELRTMTENVLREWDQAAITERRNLAEAEAKKRLGR